MSDSLEMEPLALQLERPFSGAWWKKILPKAALSSRGFQIIFLLFFLLILKMVWFDYQHHWSQPENYGWSLRSAFKDGTGLHWSSFILALDTENFHDGSRGRQLSFLFQVLNGKFQYWVYANFWPHPTISLNWIFVLFLTPPFFFKFLRNYTDSAAAAWAGLAAYFASAGYLSTVFLLFHPGKPIGNFFMILNLYLASRLWLRLKEEKEFGLGESVWFALLLTGMFTSFFLDEICWFVGIAIPVLFPSLFLVGRLRALRILAFASTFATYLAIQILVIPQLNETYHLSKFNFLNAAVGTNEGLSKFQLADFIHKIWLNFHNMFFNHSAFLAPDGWLQRLTVLSFLLLLLAALALPRSKRDPLLRALLALALFTIYQALLLTRHMEVIVSTFYYGCMFSVFYAIAFATLFAGRNGKLQVALHGALVVLMIGSFQHFTQINGGWKWGHQWLNEIWFPKLGAGMSKDITSDREMIIEAWRHWKAGGDLKDYNSRLGTQEIWMHLLPYYAKGGGPMPL